MSYVALYRKFRPKTFAEVKGQDHVVRTLKNQVKNSRIGHAYLFAGTRGTGKTSVAKVFARAVNCESGKDGEPCNCCENCKASLSGTFIDTVEIDAASNTGVDDIRRIIEEVQYTPVTGKYKVYIIDEAHMLSGNAFNAFLKTLEEPPAYVVFILATTEPHKLPITILSRCQRFDFKRIGSETIAENLRHLTNQENEEADDKALSYIAGLADGSMRDAISLLDKCIAFNLGEKLTYENVLATLGTADVTIFSRLFRAVSSSDAAEAVKVIDEASSSGRDLSRFVTDFIWYVRNLLMTGIGGSSDIPGVSPEDMHILDEDAGICSADVLMRYIRVLSGLLNEMRFSQTKQILTEVAVIKLARPQTETDYESILDRIRQVENRMSAPAEVSEVSQEADRAHVSSMEHPEDKVFEGSPEIKRVYSSSGDSPADKVCANWRDILDRLDDMTLKFSLGKYAPRRVSDNVVAIDIGRGGFYKKLLSESGNREKLSAAAAEIAGGKVEVIINSEDN